MNDRQLAAQFRSPGNEYRGVPFWAWNDELKQDELDRQVEGFKEQGMGGFMMHVREGLETPYLGEDFMARIRDTVAKAKATGMAAWLYDEDRYSSGMGGGKVPMLGGDEVRAKALTMHLSDTLELDDDTQAVYRVRIAGEQLILCSYEGQEPGDGLLRDGEQWLIFRMAIAGKNEWCHGDTYTDNLNPRSVELFIETTYEVYRQAVGEEFGKTVAGIFTDEPTIRGFSVQLQDDAPPWISWTKGLPDYYQRMHGYSIWDQLPYLFFEGEFSEQIRHNYWHTITEMFCESYTQQIANWCRHYGLPFTGHFHSEGHMGGAAMKGGAVMPHYRYLDIPGIDTLCEQTRENLTVKQVASVANQYGRQRVITETYGVTGWELTFEGRKWIGDWQYALGVNLLTHHLSWYSLKGCRKRDYPPSFNYHTNWWEHNHVPEDYFARLSAVLSQGRCEHRLLVLHPSTTVWTMLGAEVKGRTSGREEELEAYQQFFTGLVDALLAEHHEYDLGDELIIQDIGRVEGGEFKIGEAVYTTVILPGNINLLPSTLQLLLQFMDAGGRVISVGEPPRLVQGKPEAELLRMAAHQCLDQVEDLSGLIQTLEGLHPRKVSIRNRLGREEDRMLFIRRELEEMTVIFVANNDREHAVDVSLRIAGSGFIEQWDPLTGTQSKLDIPCTDNGFLLDEKFGPAGSRLYVIHNSSGAEGSGALGTSVNDQVKLQPYTGLGPVAAFRRSAPNALVLDHCQYRLGTGDWSPHMEVWRAQKEVREALGMRRVEYNGGLQRHLWLHEEHPRDGELVNFRFTFEVADVPTSVVKLVVEQGELFRAELNGEQVAGTDGEWYLDRCMKVIALPAVREGSNELILACDYTARFELEDCFLIGAFAVNASRALAEEPQQFSFGDWCLQGYPNYCGSMIYSFDVELELTDGHGYVVELGQVEAVLAILSVNGVQVKKIPWRSEYAADITRELREGQNRIELEVVGSPRNLFGPLHLARQDDSWQDWWSFRPQDKDYTPEYVLQPYGLMSQIHIKRYRI